MPSPPQISSNCPATSRHSCWDSATQGPAMRKRGCPSPTSNPHSFMARLLGLGTPGGLGLGEGRLDERGEQGMPRDRKSTRLNSSHHSISYAVCCLKKKKSGQKERDVARELTPVGSKRGKRER